MSLKDVKLYYFKVANQYAEMKNDLKDYEQAFKDGHFTEERVAEVKKEIEDMKSNFDRLSYIIYLFSLPDERNNPKYRKQYRKANEDLEITFKQFEADDEAVFNENKNLLKDIRKKLKELTKEEESGKNNN